MTLGIRSAARRDPEHVELRVGPREVPRQEGDHRGRRAGERRGLYMVYELDNSPVLDLALQRRREGEREHRPSTELAGAQVVREKPQSGNREPLTMPADVGVSAVPVAERDRVDLAVDVRGPGRDLERGGRAETEDVVPGVGGGEPLDLRETAHRVHGAAALHELPDRLCRAGGRQLGRPGGGRGRHRPGLRRLRGRGAGRRGGRWQLKAATSHRGNARDHPISKAIPFTQQ